LALWNARLTDILLTARDPRDAMAYWARLLDGEAQDGTLLLDGGTRIIVREGPQEALAEVHFDARDDVVAAAVAAGGSADERGAIVTDPDGWVLRFARVGEVLPVAFDGPTLSHCTLNSPAPSRQRDWYEGLEFLLSDALGDGFYWLRPNPIHHAMAFSRHDHANIHHLAVELPDRASFIGAIDRVVAQGGKLEFGPGRHMVGGNLFAYASDRYGIRWELCAEMGRLDPDQPPGLHSWEDRARSVNTFGPPPPASFIQAPGGPPPAGAQDS
jgi:hypothetical protein